MGQISGITEQLTVARVAVVQKRTISIHLTLALNLIAAAFSLATLIRHCARVIVVAFSVVELDLAAPQTVTQIVRARIVIITNYGRTHANAISAMVPNRAGITIYAFDIGEVFVLAPVLTFAGVFGAIIAVLAEVDIFAFNKLGLIDVIIAVVVEPVAGLGLGYLGIAIGEPGIQTDPHAMACPMLIFICARGPQSQCHGFAGTRTDSCLGHTLCCHDTIDRSGIQAQKSPRTILACLALSAAETALPGICNANIFRSSHAFAFSG